MGGGSDASAALKQQEAQRTANIQQGQDRINQVFAGFNPMFYQGVRDNTVANLMPQMQSQYKQARANLGFGLADRGLLRSSTAGQQAFNLEKQREVAQESVVNQGEEAVRNVQQQVQTQRTNLVNQLVTSQDPNLAAQQAVSAAASIHAPSPIAPLGNLFQTFANTYAAQQYGQAFNPPQPNYPVAIPTNRVTR